MVLIVNGKPEEVAGPVTLKELAESKNIAGQQVALELNGELISRDSWGASWLQAEDTIEILRFVGGG